MGRRKKIEQNHIVNLLSTENWREASPLFEIMMKQIAPLIRNLPLQDLLFMAYLAGIHNVIEAEERQADDRAVDAKKTQLS